MLPWPWDQRDSELGFVGVHRERRRRRPDLCVSLRSPVVGVATDIPPNFRISDGLPLCHPGENSQNENVLARFLPPLCKVVPAYLEGGEPGH